MLMVKSDFVRNSGVGWNASALEMEAAASASASASALAQFQANQRGTINSVARAPKAWMAVKLFGGYFHLQRQLSFSEELP